MPDCFISYVSQDQQLADFIRKHLLAQRLEVFMAPVSIQPGEQWSDVIKQNLLSSSWVIFLASRVACSSPYVQQELGMALGTSKRLVPVVWEIPPSQLPGWTTNFKH
jgi:sulfatase modifying factor 1